VEVLTLVRLIDKIDKMSKVEFVALAEAAVRPSQRDAGAVTKLIDLLDCKDPSELPKDLLSHETMNGLAELMSMLEADGVTNAKFDIKTMRGFDYYTDIVFEAFDTHPDNNRAMFGGGRYDGLVANFGVEPVPTFGFAPGDVSTQLFLESHELLPKLVSETELYVVLAGVEYRQVLKFVNQLRKEGVNTAVDVSGKKIGAQINTAEKKNVTYIVVVGEDELKNNRYKLKNIVSGAEEELSFERLVVTVKDKRNV
jgi:histidyl-tRNA synthetase